MIEIPKDIKGLIFDCDGTLADTMPLHLDAWRKAFELNGRSFPYEFIDSLKGAPAAKIIDLYNQQFNDNIDIDKVIFDKASFTKDIIPHTKPIKPVADIVLKYDGILPMAVASGGSLYNVETALSAIGLKHYFNVILTSSDKIAPKPNPDIFLEAARRINVEPQNCMVFEDGDYGLEAAERAGMKTVDVRKFL